MSDRPPPNSPLLSNASDVEETVATYAWPHQSRPDLFGIEVEAFPVLIDDQGPAGRLRLLEGGPNVIDVVTGVAESSSHILERRNTKLEFATAAGGRITFEPGAQIEHSSAPQPSSVGVRREMTAVWDELRDAFWERRVCLLSLGVDPWNEPGDIPQQLTLGRYLAMDTYFAERGPAGATMMRNTCAVQVNLDAGNGETRRERWLVANLLSPFLTAMFATSPGPGAQSRRAAAWQQMDPTRTGFPAWEATYDVDPIRDTVDRAMSADVMFITRNGETTPGRVGWTFAAWLRDGHPRAGRPTVEDLETHLTTLFTEVRPRNGVLELRGIDGLPQAWWHVPLVVAGALLYSERIRGQAIELLEGFTSRLGDVWHLAAASGLGDPEIGPVAARIANLALEAASHDPACFDPVDVAVAEAYFEEFTLRGTSPADVLSTKMTDPMLALAWAAPEHAMKGAT